MKEFIKKYLSPFRRMSLKVKYPMASRWQREEVGAFCHNCGKKVKSIIYHDKNIYNVHTGKLVGVRLHRQISCSGNNGLAYKEHTRQDFYIRITNLRAVKKFFGVGGYIDSLKRGL